MNATQIESLRYRWDDQFGVTPGWYCECRVDDRIVSDSVKIDFPLNVDDFGRDDESDLREALAAAFPNASLYYDC